MATKKAKRKASSDKDEEAVKATAKITLIPSTNSAAIIAEYGNIFGNQSLEKLFEELQASSKKIIDGDMKQCESMLWTQAEALQSIFTNLSRRAINQEYLSNFEMFLKLALKAQSQCRQTLETLSTIKNPPVVYARQANISSGPQQVNNGITNEPTRREEKQNRPNELLEVIDGKRLDTRATEETSRGDQALAALE